jgi:hypothetical protein
MKKEKQYVPPTLDELKDYRLKNLSRFYENCLSMINQKLDMMLDKITKQDGTVDRNQMLICIDDIQAFIRNDTKIKID